MPRIGWADRALSRRKRMGLDHAAEDQSARLTEAANAETSVYSAISAAIPSNARESVAQFRIVFDVSSLVVRRKA